MTRQKAFFGTSLFLGLGLAAAPAHAQGGNVSLGGSASTDNGAHGTASASGAAPAAAPAAPADEWAERDKKLNEPLTLSGGTGLLRTQYAQSGAPGQFRLGFTTEYFSAGFLCTSDFPCRNPRGGADVTSDSLDHIGGTLTLSVTLLKFLEAYAGTRAYANSDDQNKPTLLQVLGDTDFGLKAFTSLSKVFHVGGFAELWLINGTGSVGLDGGGTGFKFGPIFTADLRGMEKKLPLRFSLQADYMFDNSGAVLETTENARKEPVTRIERFGLGVNRVDHLDINLGGEAFLLEEKIRPFVEYGMLLPTNRQSYACKPNNPSHDKCMANDTVVPSQLTLGSRFFPWKRGFNLTAALDVGVTGVGTFVEELSPTPPWTLYLGAGWNVDTQDRPPSEHVKLVEKTLEKVLAHVKGSVHEAGQTAGIGDAIVSWANHNELTSLATAPDGHFTTQGLPEGQYDFAVKADGYKDGACTGTIPAGSTADVVVDCPLTALPKVGSVVGHVKDADGGGGVANATVRLTDGAKHELTFSSDASGNFRGEQIAPGGASFTVEADGYLALVMPFDVKVRTENQVDLLMHKRPKNALVNVGANEIRLKQQVQFAVDSAVILPESLQLMSEIADALIHTPRIHKVEIQGHTDNTGSADHNKILSEQRAEAVRAWLVDHGVQGDRLVAKGYGQEKPLVPNVTTANKARNRRVQFIIQEQDAAPAVSPAAPKPAVKATDGR